MSENKKQEEVKPIKACARCEAERGILNRSDFTKSHGQCKRHFIELLVESEGPHTVDDIVEGLQIMTKNQSFCEDLSGKDNKI